MLDQGRERRPEPALFGIAKRDERAAAALDEQRRFAAEQHDPCARDPGGPRSRPLRPRQRRAVRLCGIGGGEHERVGLVAFPRPQLAQPLDRAAKRKLRAAEAFDEVAAPAEAENLERLQLPVDGAVAAWDALAADAVARDDSLPLEQQLGERAPVRLLARKQALRPRPAALGGRDLARTPAREPARPSLRLRHAVAASGSQRLPGVVRDLAGPDEIPKRR